MVRVRSGQQLQVPDQLGHLVPRPDQADGEHGQVVGVGLGQLPEVVVVHAGGLGRGGHVGGEQLAIRLPDTVGVFVVSGNEDFLLHVAVADNQQLYAFVIDKLTERPEVADVRTSVIYEHLRNHAVAPAARP